MDDARRELLEYILAAICVLAAAIVAVLPVARPESEAALIGIAGAAIGAVFRGRTGK